MNPEVMGAAIERAGKDIDALVFYEEWRDRSRSTDKKRYAQLRWVVCKLRQANRQNSPANRKEAQRVLEKYGWDEEVLHDPYPVLSNINLGPADRSDSGLESQANQGAVKAPIELQDRQAHSLGNLEFRLFLSQGWVNIDSADGLRARVVIADRTIESMDVKFQELEDNSWKCTQ